MKLYNTSTEKFTVPIAIEFFNLYQAILKDGGKNADSLPEKLRNDNRQTIYNAIDQQGIYKAMLRPVMDSLKMKIISGSEWSGRNIVLCDMEMNYILDLNFFKQKDGVVLFKPGKKPVLWTKDCLTESCSARDFILNYFN